MNTPLPHEVRHVFRNLAACFLPLLVMAGCSSGISGHAPGVAGVQTLAPGTLNYPLAYVKRPQPTADIDARDLITSTNGGDLYLREQASAGVVETNITKSITLGTGDVRDLDVSPDGKKLIFSLRLKADPKKPVQTQPTWKIYEYDAVAKTVTQLTNDFIQRGHDVGAHYLPDGRIVFASTRQAATQALLIDEGRPQYPAQTDDRKQDIFLLHVMNFDGGNIHQISFNTNHDFAPSVLANGQIIFSRYDTVNGDQISLYRTNPDGTGLELLYGENSHMTGANMAGSNNNVIQFLNPRQRADGKTIAIVRPFLGTQQGGDVVQIDTDGYVENHQPSVPGGGTGPAQASATTLGVTTDANLPSLGGRFHSVYPLYDGTNRMLVSWAPCLVQASATSTVTSVCTASNTAGIIAAVNAANAAAAAGAPAPATPAGTPVLAPAQYTVWLYDVAAQTLSPLVGADPGMEVVEPVIMQARTPLPLYIPDNVPTGQAATLANNPNGGIGILHIKSVYDFDGVDSTAQGIATLADPKQTTADQRPARFIRLVKAVEIPCNRANQVGCRKINNSAFGPAGMGMREILGYAPIEPDGSVKVQVPANVPFTIDILDKNARRISAQHTSWLQVMPGETKTCNGCHTQAGTNPTSHGRTGLTASINPGAPTAGAPFPNTLATLPAVNAGDTMAYTRAANTCVTTPGSTLVCSEVPSIDVLYADVWTDPVAAGRAADASFSYLYSDLSTPSPANGHCKNWDPLCRSTIHYPDATADTTATYQIQAIWNLPRQTLAADGVTVLADHTCVLCHNTVNAANAIQVPQGQLNLTDAASAIDITVTVSYEDLLFPHNAQTLNMGVLTDLTVPAPGPPDPKTGLPTTIQVPVSLAAPATAGSAGGSTAFLRMFDGSYHDPVLDHTGYLTAAELRLIVEWLDIGAQYYNDPFVAPLAP